MIDVHECNKVSKTNYVNENSVNEKLFEHCLSFTELHEAQFYRMHESHFLIEFPVFVFSFIENL